MARSVWKGPFVDGYLLAKAETAKASSRNEIIKIWSRRSTILPYASSHAGASSNFALSRHFRLCQPVGLPYRFCG